MAKIKVHNKYDISFEEEKNPYNLAFFEQSLWNSMYSLLNFDICSVDIDT